MGSRKSGLGISLIKKWRCGWESNPRIRDLQSLPLATWVPHLLEQHQYTPTAGVKFKHSPYTSATKNTRSERFVGGSKL